ncbi:MAG: ferrous iron transport protein A [Firmicutes bacterium]|nr:ferrous iron transport protein A [Bacillota bacterium]
MKAVVKSKPEHKCLYDVQKNCCCRVVAMPEHPLLDSLGICSDALITVQNKYRFGGPVLLKIDTATVALGKDIARQILVEEVAS